MDFKKNFNVLFLVFDQKENQFLSKKRKNLLINQKNIKYFKTEKISEQNRNINEVTILDRMKIKKSQKNIFKKNTFHVKNLKLIKSNKVKKFRSFLKEDNININKSVFEKTNPDIIVDRFVTQFRKTILNHSKSFNQSLSMNTPIQTFNDCKKENKLSDFIVEMTLTSRDLPIEIFHEIFKYLRLSEICKSSAICKEWQTYCNNIFCNYHFFREIKSQNYPIKEFQNLLIKGKPLKHISILNQIIKRDFGNHPQNLINSNILQLKLSKDFNSKNNYILESFKIKPIKNIMKNLLSNSSVESICKSSKYTLKELSLIGCYKLTEKISESLSQLIYLEKLDLSFSELNFIYKEILTNTHWGSYSKTALI